MARPAAPALLSRHHALLTLGLIGLALLPRAAASQTAVDPRGRYAEVAGALTPTIERLRAQHGIPAISLALVDGSRIVWARGFGWADSAAGVAADAATVYRVGSVSKLFTDMAVMQLVERKELALDAPVRRYLPDFQPTNPFGGDITLRELTSHRSGLTREPPVGHYFDDTQPTLAATVASLNGTKLVYPPAAHTKYSNAGVAVLGYVLERTRGEPFGDYLQHTVLEPMGMSQSAFEPLPGSTHIWRRDRCGRFTAGASPRPRSSSARGPPAASTPASSTSAASFPFSSPVAPPPMATGCWRRPRSTRCGHRNTRPRATPAASGSASASVD